MAICEVQFLEKHIDDIEFSDKISEIVWTGIKHGLESSVKGYVNKKGEITTPLPRGSENVSTPLEQGEEEEEGEGEEKGEEEEKGEGAISVITPATKVADYLLNKILSEKPNFKKPNMQTWAKDIDKAMRIDGRTEQELTGCIDWIYTKGTFWIPNILSGRKLREKFDTMEAQMMRNSKSDTAMVDKIYDSGLTAKEIVKAMEAKQ
jgi:uncharacterized sporulation protein YeaH/YhbH (DUF444 family)